mmetsp:Transcript_6392/g.18418  ORF Transcript_6392/g.18418 Transcript_6392/m.18418 type:complete len:157 (+) Transcript_6392:97-567(+)|eukprot:CAMPEP_0206141594 /NCGR_PEP_ID=MMETSP1473-20131121/13503_1 /ASSEMBLY_ACC=CAM_ASM_001109 /TAXON_ID=1461547 /ORGANISM="Stichococcus sp, Strain RCC1054" /LENGTH=156 /DNA_ID=CAMNT_0053536223 /DNA_START=92 /DNA_END=562 /DNA_ORIENTATION=-
MASAVASLAGVPCVRAPRLSGAGRLRSPSMGGHLTRQSPQTAARHDRRHDRHHDEPRKPAASLWDGPMEELAEKLGDDVHAEMNGWRLYLRNMKSSGGKNMAQTLAEKVVMGIAVEDALKELKISLGAGKKDISLFDVIPSTGINNAKNAVRDLER